MKLIKNTGTEATKVFFYLGSWHRAYCFAPNMFYFQDTYLGVLRGWGYLNETA